MHLSVTGSMSFRAVALSYVLWRLSTGNGGSPHPIFPVRAGNILTYTILRPLALCKKINPYKGFGPYQFTLKASVPV